MLWPLESSDNSTILIGGSVIHFTTGAMAIVEYPTVLAVLTGGTVDCTTFCTVVDFRKHGIFAASGTHVL